MEKKAIFAGGCFWCMEAAFAIKKGVIKTVSGYIGGDMENASYEDVVYKDTGHHEAVEVTYDPSKVSYNELLDIYWQSIDPTDEGGQFADRGKEYKTAIFYLDEDQKRKALESKKKLDESGKFDAPIATKTIKASKFYPAEDYHQEYYKKNPIRYKTYKVMSGREGFLKKKWKDGQEI